MKAMQTSTSAATTKAEYNNRFSAAGLISAGALVAVLATGCSELANFSASSGTATITATKTVTAAAATPPSPGPQASSNADEERSNANPDATNEESDTPELGTRENPFPIGTPVSNSEWKITLGMPRVADDEVAAENQFNSPPRRGMEYVIVPVTAEYKGTGTGNLLFVRVGFVGNDNVTYDDHCGVVPDELSNIGDLYKGGVAKGNTCVTVPQPGRGLWTLKTGFLGEPAFFAITSPRTVVPPAKQPATTPAMVLAAADVHGFVDYAGDARCSGADRAAILLRTPQSALVVCRSAGGGAYYRGLRLKDMATIELTKVAVNDSGSTAVVTDTDDGTRYEISNAGLEIVKNGQVLSSEPAIEFATP
jgi:hypothetical protein